ncbi:MAG: hypothetical protein QGF59_14925 [Pirellulaceae bacterium]|jgi:hypothetical protein|nr:hypothetical protein [Planctomycetaceae bacterium]MDP6553669.1 hypothetical protein [Pirellulaceae bacterium]MDP6719952.1 hypothetical protein [Pirellulaceae bacterium]
MNQKLSLVILALAHVLCGLTTGFFAENGPPEILLAIYVGLFFSQTSLLGIWGGLATLGWPIRLVGVTIGLAYLGPQFCFSLGNWGSELLLLVFLSTVVVAGVMLVVRWFMARLERTAMATNSVSAEGLQFSIRHLMLLTFVIGCILGIGRWLQPYFQRADQLAFILTLSLCFVSVGVTSVWALLGRAHLILRSCVVLFIGLLTACIPTYSLEEGELWFWITMMIVEATVLLASLFVVRLCGFRLVRTSYGKTTGRPEVP